MIDQRLQVLQVLLSKSLNRAGLMDVFAERPLQPQFLFNHQAVDFDQVAAFRLATLNRTGRFVSQLEDFRIRHTIHLAQVIETDFWLRIRLQLFLFQLIVAQVSQHAVSDSTLRNLSQLFFDRLQGGTRFGLIVFQENRILGRKPTYRSRQIDVVKQFFAPVAFQIDGNVI